MQLFHNATRTHTNILTNDSPFGKGPKESREQSLLVGRVLRQGALDFIAAGVVAHNLRQRITH